METSVRVMESSLDHELVLEDVKTSLEFIYNSKEFIVSVPQHIVVCCDWKYFTCLLWNIFWPPPGHCWWSAGLLGRSAGHGDSLHQHGPGQEMSHITWSWTRVWILMWWWELLSISWADLCIPCFVLEIRSEKEILCCKTSSQNTLTLQ